MVYLKLERRRPTKLEMRGSHYEEEKRKNFVFVLLLLLCLIIPFSTVTVFSAQFYWGRDPKGGSVKLRLIDGRNGQFTINANVVNAPCGETYASLIKKGVNNWNNAGAGVNYSNGSISFYTPRSDDVWGVKELYKKMIRKWY